MADKKDNGLFYWRKHVEVPSPHMTSMRNKFTAQSALLRGEHRVGLHNSDRLGEKELDTLRRVPPPDPKLSHLDEFAWPRQGDWTQATTREKKDVEIENHIPDGHWEGFKLTWVDCIGTGGYGLATLWRVTFEDGEKRLVVMKMEKFDRPGRFNAQDESRWHLEYEGSSHTVQVVDLMKIVEQKRKTTAPKIHGERFMPHKLNVLVLEYAEGGSLYSLMSRVDATRVIVPKPVLQEMWDCLVLGVVSVQFQPSHQASFEASLKSALDGDVEALIRSLKRSRTSEHVHFDLEESNVLIGKAPLHGSTPALKLHDFGAHSYDMPEIWDEEKEDFLYWKLRFPPKILCATPEQIHEDWDSIIEGDQHFHNNFAFDNLNKGSKVAGRYGSWTNIFLIGKVMEKFVTGIRIYNPMNKKSYTSLDGLKKGMTYGWRAAAAQKEDLNTDAADIIDEVIQCQYEDPKLRPTIEELLRAIHKRRQAEGGSGHGNDDPESVNFWKRIIQDITLLPLKSGYTSDSSSDTPIESPSSDSPWQPYDTRRGNNRGAGRGLGRGRGAARGSTRRPGLATGGWTPIDNHVNAGPPPGVPFPAHIMAQQPPPPGVHFPAPFMGQPPPPLAAQYPARLMGQQQPPKRKDAPLGDGGRSTSSQGTNKRRKP